jgi:hypothetical protein
MLIINGGEEELKAIFKVREPNIFKRDTPQNKQDGINVLLL